MKSRFWKRNLEKIKKATLTKPYIYSFIFIFLAYLVINVIVNQLYVTAPVIFTYNLKIIIPFLFFTLLVAILVGININLVFIKFRELRQVKKEGGLSFIGVFGGVLGGACPSCFVGLFPAILGLFGVTASLSTLPFFGIEILIGSAIILIISMFLLTRDNVCKIKVKRGDKK